jgi:tRNA A-37 threonylcarbamoyl transferase component Bud32
LIVLERVEGSVLAHADLDAINPGQREMLFRRTGRILRQIDDLGLSHFDAKSTNWIVQEDSKLGPRPIVVDADAIRFRRWRALGIERLLRAMRDHPQYTVADSLALCQGYSPFSRIEREQPV